MGRLGLVVLVFCGCWPGIGAAQTEWVVGSDTLLDPGPAGSFDAGGGWPGEVVFDGSQYHLYYVGFPVAGGEFFDGWQIGHATSADGLSWEKDPGNPVVGLGPPGAWNSRSLSKPAVEYDGSTFHMWFVGGDEVQAAAGYATSVDGSTWTEYAGNLVLEPDGPGSWESPALAPHSVVFDGSTYRMWYYAGPSVDEFQIGFAQSSDGVSWTKHPEPVITPGRPGSWDSFSPHEPAVLFDGARYHMWYTAGDGAVYGIGYARSDDGIEWVRHVSNPVVTYGSMAISSTVLAEGGGYRMWFAGADGIHHATSTEDRFMSRRLFIPAAAYAPGVGGSFFETDVDVSNTDGTTVTYRFLWLPRGASNAEPFTSGFLSLEAGASARYTNVLSEVLGLAAPALGGLAVEASSPGLIVMSRTYNLDRSGASGSYGQAMPAIAEDDMIGPNQRRRIVFGTETAAFRTNVGCQNGSTRLGVVDLELLDQRGATLATERLLLQPWSNDQLNRVFADYRPVQGVVDISSAAASASFYCYGSVLDSATSDPTTIPPQ